MATFDTRYKVFNSNDTEGLAKAIGDYFGYEPVLQSDGDYYIVFPQDSYFIIRNTYDASTGDYSETLVYYGTNALNKMYAIVYSNTKFYFRTITTAKCKTIVLNSVEGAAGVANDTYALITMSNGKDVVLDVEKKDTVSVIRHGGSYGDEDVRYTRTYLYDDTISVYEAAYPGQFYIDASNDISTAVTIPMHCPLSNTVVDNIQLLLQAPGDRNYFGEVAIDNKPYFRWDMILLQDY